MAVVRDGRKPGCDTASSSDTDCRGLIRTASAARPWINPAAERLLGDIRGKRYTSVVAPEETRRAQELFTRKVLGTTPATDATAFLVSTAGTRVPVEISAVPLRSGEQVVGVFGLVEERPDDRATAPRASHPRQPRCFAIWSRAAPPSRSPPNST